MPPAGFQPAVPARQRSQIYVLDRAASAIALLYVTLREVII